MTKIPTIVDWYLTGFKVGGPCARSPIWLLRWVDASSSFLCLQETTISWICSRIRELPIDGSRFVQYYADMDVETYREMSQLTGCLA
jgi:hypothetical protein